MTATLQIEHAISSLETWRGAFDLFSSARADAGVRAERIRQPLDDNEYVALELDFDSAEEAAKFEGFLRSVVWASPDASPGLVGSPQTRILRVVGE